MSNDFYLSKIRLGDTVEVKWACFGERYGDKDKAQSQPLEVGHKGLVIGYLPDIFHCEKHQAIVYFDGWQWPIIVFVDNLKKIEEGRKER